MNVEREQVARSHLAHGERLLWSGQPRGGIRFRLADAFLVPFSLLWGGFAVFWEWGVLQTPAPGFFALFGVPFVLMGLYITVGRFFVDAWQRSKTTYFLTDQRAVILSGLFSTQMKSLPLRSMADFTFSERGDRSGTITFGSPSIFGSGMMVPGWPGAGRHQQPAFEMIEDVRLVHEQLRTAVIAAGGGGR